MRSYVLRRIVGIIPLLFIASVVIFLIIHLVPGDPALNLLPPNPPDEQIVAVRARYGLDRPLHEQYLSWLTRAAQGDLGRSISNGFAVAELLSQRFGVTVQLALCGFGMALLIAFPLGIAAGLRPGGLFSHLTSAYTALGFVIPSFWLGILLILFFGVFLGTLPTSGYVSFFEDPVRALRYMLLPAFTVCVGTSVIIANFLRFSVGEVAQSEFVTAAVAKGLPYRRIVIRHILLNAMIPVITVAALQFGTMLAGTVITESLFSIPGMGRLLVDAIAARDYAVLQGTLLVIVIIFIAINFVTDLLYAQLDPRIRLD